MQRKYVVITGGVLSGLGKGIALASICNILSQDYKIVPIKCDGYLNVDPGTMNPIEHGEVFVLDDGGEVDMDFGHYERFLDVSCKKDSNLTMGKVFDEIRKKERRGDYLGKTVQMVPHVRNFIRDYIIQVGDNSHADIVAIEIGGTVGDMENELYLHAVRDLARIVGKENILFVHLTYVPIPTGVNEQKSKPTQQSIADLLSRGIQPEIIIARCSQILSEHVKSKIAQFGNIKRENVITGIDIDDVYKIPLVFEEQGMSQLLARKFNIPIRPNLDKWRELISKKENANKEITIAIAGKYTSLEDSYASIIESLNHCSAHLNTKINVKWIETENGFELEKIDGVIVPGGFGSRGVEGKIKAVKYCRENNIPFLGICYGLQMAVIDFARNVCGLKNANTTEVNPKTEHPVIHILKEQKNIQDKGGTMRLGAYLAKIKQGTKIFSLYKTEEVSERHRHRYEVNPKYHNILQENGLIFSGMSPDKTLVEFLEIKNHPYFVATQAHPELKSSLIKPAPIFKGLIEAAIKKKYGNQNSSNSSDSGFLE
ncbi:MAG: CTP synthase (glutamine hydrolyzing) [Candidatus Pacearchaeota archaeon]|nr:CTP synthase (glutamine hydrolyzing) [Candidatus Pacearchaeota archaeon]